MELGKTLYVTLRCEWRNWLSANHKTEKEIWLVGYPKNSGNPSLPSCQFRKPLGAWRSKHLSK